ncbi:SMU1112c/YaeR family gloxylase I-like metalloprotein, partial [Piscirickettsia salmonis]|uniref:SMU1112c/YaeR family gloxylase I-like metalloprotein n=1 Tax=Piscirickettsia salmonis TaxID=1238 RepID=UPI003EB982AB
IEEYNNNYAQVAAVKKIHHVALIVSDYAASKAFYCDILGLEVIAETYRRERRSYKLDLKLMNGNQLELFSFVNPPKRLSFPEACGLRHLAFAVENINESVKCLQQHGIDVEPVRVDALTEKKYTFFSDPDGLPLELYEI